MPGSRDHAQRGDAAARRSGADLTPFRDFAESVSAEGGELVEQVSALIDQAQAFAAAQVNATLTLRNWYIGRLIDVAVLREGRAGHDQELVASLAQQLTSRYGRGYDRTNLYRMVRFSQQFTEPELVASLAQHVSWTHFRELLPLATDDARAFYVKEIIDRHLSVRELRHAISRKAFERREIADSQIPEGSAVPLDAFRLGARPRSGSAPRHGGVLVGGRSRVGVRRTPEAHDLRWRRLLPRPAVLLPSTASADRGGVEGREVQAELPGADELLPEVAGSARTPQTRIRPSASSCVPRRAVTRSSCSNYTRTGSWSPNTGRPCHRRRSSRPESKRSTGRHRSGSRGGSSPQRRKKTVMSRNRLALDAASSAAHSGF